MDRVDRISVDALARAKGLDARWLRDTFGLADGLYAGGGYPQIPAVAIPYRDECGGVLFIKHRLATGGRQPFGVPLAPYGLENIRRCLPGTPLYLVEGESDTWTARLHGFHAVGLPGATSWNAVRHRLLPLLRVRPVAVWQESGEAAQVLVRAIARDLPTALVLTADMEAKDLNALHLRHGAGFRTAFGGYVERAVPIAVRAASLIRRIPAPSRRRRVAFLGGRTKGVEDDRKLDSARKRSTVEYLQTRGCRFRGVGKSAMTRCPFPEHTDLTPSFSVHRETGAWVCFGCGRKGGDAIDLSRQLDGGSFRDAVARVAQ